VSAACACASGSLSLGDVQAFIQYSRQFTQPLTQLASMINVMQSGIASAERVFELLDADEERGDAVPPRIPIAAGRVRVRARLVPYDPNQPLIEDLSLVAEPGETVAIVGPTGAARRRSSTSSCASTSSTRARSRSTASTSRRCRAATAPNIGMVLQDTWLFGGTIRENIATATSTRPRTDPRRGEGDVRRPFVHSLPDGYDTVIDDEGAPSARARSSCSRSPARSSPTPRS
jgi:ATP-binding cassette subfamily B protein